MGSVDSLDNIFHNAWIYTSKEIKENKPINVSYFYSFVLFFSFAEGVVGSPHPDSQTSASMQKLRDRCQSLEEENQHVSAPLYHSVYSTDFSFELKKR
jgi:hypothetical protein